MQNYHDPIKHIKFLRQTLSQDKKPIGFFISAGCPLAVNMPKGQWPLIADVAGLTKYLAEELRSKTDDKINLIYCLMKLHYLKIVLRMLKIF